MQPITDAISRDMDSTQAISISLMAFGSIFKSISLVSRRRYGLVSRRADLKDHPIIVADWDMIFTSEIFPSTSMESPKMLSKMTFPS
jgi:hypothetical protein